MKNIKMSIQHLAEAANGLDLLGMHKEADAITSVMARVAQFNPNALDDNLLQMESATSEGNEDDYQDYPQDNFSSNPLMNGNSMNDGLDDLGDYDENDFGDDFGDEEGMNDIEDMDMNPEEGFDELDSGNFDGEGDDPETANFQYYLNNIVSTIPKQDVSHLI